MPKSQKRKQMPQLFKQILTQPKFNKQKHEALLLQEKNKKKREKEIAKARRALGPSSDQIEDWYLSDLQRQKEEREAKEKAEQRRINHIKKIRADIMHQR